MCGFGEEIRSSILLSHHILETSQTFLSRMKKGSVVSLYNRILSSSENKLLLDNRLLGKNGKHKLILSIYSHSSGNVEKLK